MRTPPISQLRTPSAWRQRRAKSVPGHRGERAALQLSLYLLLNRQALSMISKTYSVAFRICNLQWARYSICEGRPEHRWEAKNSQKRYGNTRYKHSTVQSKRVLAQLWFLMNSLCRTAESFACSFGAGDRSPRAIMQR
jgi:hypothetical protein